MEPLIHVPAGRPTAKSPRPPGAAPRRLRAKSGFTILEVAMAATVMALGISSAILVMQRGFASLDTARCLGYASQIMQSEMEKTRLTPWGNGASAGTGSTGITSFPTAPTSIAIDTTFFNGNDLGSRMTLTRAATDVHTGMIQITFTITWQSYDRRTLSRTYTTYYGQKGLYDFISI
jgi:Tfp pilus assembly protein PilV